MVKHIRDYDWMDTEEFIRPTAWHIERRKMFWRKALWGVLFVLAALWVGYEAAPYLGMFAVTLQEGLH